MHRNALCKRLIKSWLIIPYITKQQLGDGFTKMVIVKTAKKRSGVFSGSFQSFFKS